MPKEEYHKQDEMECMQLLYEKFYARLHRYAHTFLDDEEDAADVVGDVFMSIWESWKGNHEIAANPPASFLYTAVKNKCLDRLRHNKAGMNYIQQMESMGEMTTDTEVEEFEQRITQLHHAIKQLPKIDQQVLKCTYFKNMTYRQTAEQLEITESMVHKHMIKIYKVLRSVLKIIIIGYQTLGVIVSTIK